MVGDPICVCAPFPVFFRCFRCAQCLEDFFHPHGKDQTVRVPFYRFDQLPVFLSVQRFCQVVRSPLTPSHPPVFHPHRDHRTVLVFLYSHIFIDDPFPCFRQCDPSLLVWYKPLPVIPQILIQFPRFFYFLYLLRRHSLYCPRRSGYTPASPLSFSLPASPGSLSGLSHPGSSF